MTDHNARQAGLTLIREKLARFVECVEDDEDTDIGREYLDALTTLGLLARTQRSPAQWCITDAGSDFLAAHSADARNGEGVAMQVLREIIAHDDAWEKETQTSRVSTSRADGYLAEFMALKDKARALLEKDRG